MLPILATLLLSQTPATAAQNGIRGCLAINDIKEAGKISAELLQNSSRIHTIGTLLVGGEAIGSQDDFYLITTVPLELQTLIAHELHLLDLLTIANNSTEAWTQQYASQQFTDFYAQFENSINKIRELGSDMPARTMQSLRAEIKETVRLVTDLRGHFASCAGRAKKPGK